MGGPRGRPARGLGAELRCGQWPLFPVSRDLLKAAPAKSRCRSEQAHWGSWRLPWGNGTNVGGSEGEVQGHVTQEVRLLHYLAFCSRCRIATAQLYSFFLQQLDFLRRQKYEQKRDREVQGTGSKEKGLSLTNRDSSRIRGFVKTSCMYVELNVS